MRASELLPWALLFVVFHKQAQGSILPASGTLPTGVIPVPKIHTGGPNWQQERFSALAAQGILGDVARAIVAHWGFETGWGAGEWNYNVGNRIALAGDRGVDIGVTPTGERGHGWYKAYGALSDAVHDYLALVQSPRYAQAWTLLLGAPRSSAWIRQLVKSGYATLSADEYERRYSHALERLA